jgi:DNA-binding transcriptional regulator YiaG
MLEQVSRPKAKKELKMAMPLKQTEVQYTGKNLISFLTEKMDISSTMLAALLQVTDRTLSNWQHDSYDDLDTPGKSRRLVTLYSVVVKALKSGLPETRIINFLQEPIEESNEESQTPLSYIVGDSDPKLFLEVVNHLIGRFL